MSARALVTARPIGSEASIAITQFSALFLWIVFEMLRPVRLENDRTLSPRRKPRSQMQHQAHSFMEPKRVLDKGESDCETALKIEERRKQ
jgi:hypothetical protein